MKNRIAKCLACCMLMAVAALAGTAQAQVGGSAQMQVRIAPPGGGGGYPSPSKPRLGFYGQMIYGYGMKIISVNYNSPLREVGAEYGDTIYMINNQRILSQMDYDRELMNSALYRGGWASLVIRNVRYDMGMSPQEFVYVSVRVLGGAGVPVGGVQAYGAPAQGAPAQKSGGGVIKSGNGVISETPATSQGGAATEGAQQIQAQGGQGQ